MREHRALIIYMSFRSYRGHFCRTCATSILRTATTWTLALGWWSPLSLVIFTPFTLIWNAVTHFRIRKLERPFARPVGRAPREEGPPIVLRPLAYVALGPALWFVWALSSILADAS